MSSEKQSKSSNGSCKTSEELSYKRIPQSASEMKKTFSNKERKAFKRKWKEEKLLTEMEKQKKIRKENEQKCKEEEEEKRKKDRLGRIYTVSIALPGSIMDNAQSMELRAYLAGQIARAAAVFNVDEIVIFDEINQTRQDTREFNGLKKPGQGNSQLFHILQYLECPQYLRKQFFPYHPDLSHAGLLNPLDTPHHLRETDVSEYREGITLNKPLSAKKETGSYANVGLKKEVLLNMVVPPGQRVTVKLKEQTTDKKNLIGVVVSPNEPRESAGIYWGYTVRMASCLSKVFAECPHDGGYDLTIGTSERGNFVEDLSLKPFKHAVVVFGGLKGLEASLESDNSISSDDPKDIFHHYVNVCPNQGSRTIRTEEAILIAMTALSPKLAQINKPILNS